MNSTTLRGIFPEPRQPHKRNFIKENVKQIKQIQGVVQNTNMVEQRSGRMKSTSQQNATLIPNSAQPLAAPQNRSLSVLRVPGKTLVAAIKKKEPEVPKATNKTLQLPQGGEKQTPDKSMPDKHINRGVQTESPDRISKLYESGTVKYPSPSALKPALSPRRTPSPLKREPHGGTQLRLHDRGDSTNVLINTQNQDFNLQNLDGDKHDFIKENIMALKQRAVSSRPEQSPDSKLHPKGVVPKYLRERKEEAKKLAEEGDSECPEGHVRLPDEERKETLRVLRQSYADRIQELNSMPVRNDTLRMRNRKMAIEEELRKIDEGIKVFQRPKVYVKINA